MALAGILVKLHYCVKEEKKTRSDGSVRSGGGKETMKMSIHSMIFDVCMCLLHETYNRALP